MYCPKCGTQNNENTKFCSSCGYLLMPATQTGEEQVKTAPPVKEETSTEAKKETVNTVQPTDKKSTNVQYFFVMLAALLKPATVLKEDLNKFNQIKSSAIMTLIITAIATIVFPVPLPRIATITIARSSPGKARRTSITLEMTESTQPP